MKINNLETLLMERCLLYLIIIVCWKDAFLVSDYFPLILDCTDIFTLYFTLFEIALNKRMRFAKKS